MKFAANAIALTSFTLAVSIASWSQAQSANNAATTTCNFTDGKQLTVRYQSAPLVKKKLRAGEMWTPGGLPMFLFTQSDLTLGGSEIPVGAYSMYVIGGKKEWTLIINKNVKENTAYDQKQDLIRAKMEIGEMESEGDSAKVIFGHISEKQCNMRIYRAEIGGWVEFKEK